MGYDIPIWVYYAVTAAAAVAGGVTAYNAAEYQKDTAAANEAAAKREGTSIALLEAAEGRADVGRARALAGASGLTVDGSAEGVIGSLAAMGEFNARSALYQGRRRAQQFQSDQMNARANKNAAIISTVGDGATALTSGMRTNSTAGPTPYSRADPGDANMTT
jgi:hypothetical protein